MTTRILSLFLTCATLLAQRTPVKVNGVVVDNPNFTNSASLSWTRVGANISGSLGTNAVTNITINGTANQVIVSGSPVSSGGTVTLSAPQDLATNSNPHFAGLSLDTNFIAGSGTDRSVLATAPMGNFGFIKGTTADPDTSTNPLVKVVRTVNVQDADAFGDAGENMAAISGIAYGVITNQLQPVGVFGGAVNLSTNFSGTTPNDALGVYGIGRINATGTGRGIGGFFEGRRDSSVAKQNALQVLSYNGGGTNEGYIATAAPATMGVFIAAGGDADSGAAIVVANPTSTAKQYSYGLAFSGQILNGHTGAVTTASIVDDSVDPNSILIRGIHDGGSIVVASGSGAAVFGDTSPSYTTTRLEVQGENASADPLVFFGANNFTKSYSTILHNAAGSLRLGIVGSTGAFLTGTAVGDSAIFPTSGDSVHIGGTAKVLTVSSANALSFFGGAAATTSNEVYNALSPTTTRGDITVRNSTVNARLGIGRVGSILTPWPNTDNTTDLVWRKAPEVWEFSSSAVGQWTAMALNSGSGGTANGDGADIGFFTGITGTLTNGMGGYRLAAGNTLLSTNLYALHWRIKSPAGLSSASDGYELVVGGNDATTYSDRLDGVYFYYTHSVSNGVWCGITSSNGVTSFATGAPTTPPTVTINTLYDLFLTADSTTANFWVSTDNMATVQWIGASTSNLPLGAGREFSNQAYIRKIGPDPSGTTSRTVLLGRCVLWPQ